MRRPENCQGLAWTGHWVVPVPVSDVDRAKAFYIEKIGFDLDHDVQPGNGMRVVQLTPPGSACSIVMGTGMPEIKRVRLCRRVPSPPARTSAHEDSAVGFAEPVLRRGSARRDPP